MKQNIIGRCYRHLVKPCLFLMHPDKAHAHFVGVGSFLQRFSFTKWLTRSLFAYTNEKVLGQTLAGIYFSNPVGLSAGFDKDGQLYDLMSDVGFGFTQVGSVTRYPYEGNTQPRSHRLLKSKGLIINYGLKNEGIERIAQDIKHHGEGRIPVSMSVAKTNCDLTASDEAGIADYVDCLKYIEQEDLGNFYTINVSCPNTFGGEPFTTPDRLEKLLDAIALLQLSKPVFVKLPIELEWPDFQALLDVILRYSISGVVIGNLKKKREGYVDPKELEETKDMKGGVSGKPTESTCNALITKTYVYCGEKLIIVGVGGIFSAEDAYEKIKRGASLVQLITGMVYQGPQLIGEINKGLVALLGKDGYKHISEAVGQK